MALTMCPECQQQVSTAAQSCPHCGYVPAAGQTQGAPSGYAQQQGYGQQQGHAQQEILKSATAAMWLGLSSLLCGLPGPIGLIMGLQAQKQFKAAPGRYKNTSHATVAVVAGAVGSLFLLIGFINASASKDNASTDAPQAVSKTAQPLAAANPVKSEPKTFISETCLELATNFGPQSKMSDLQKEELWPQYQGKFFKWQLEVTEVSSDTFGGYTVQFKCAPRSPSLIQDVQLKYQDEAKSFVMGLQKGSAYEIKGKLGGSSTLLGMSGDGILE